MEELKNLIRELTNEVDNLREDVRADRDLRNAEVASEHKKRKSQRLRDLGLLILLLITIAGGFWRGETAINKIRHETKTRTYNQCVNSNKARATIQIGFRTYNEVLINAAGSNQELTPAAKAQRQQQIDAFRQSIEARVIAPLKPLSCPPAPK